MNWPHFREPVSAWTHFTWMVLALPAAWFLWRACRANLLKQVGVLIFGLSLVDCYGCSWLFHSVAPPLVRPFATLDHIGIFMLIAGTATPIGLVMLRGRARRAMVGGLWLLALSGSLLCLVGEPGIPVLTVLYLVMGWIGCAAYFELADRLGHARVVLLWAGGLLYTVGAVLNGLKWPRLSPGVFGPHELFHLFAMAGTAAHYLFVLAVVLPYQPGPAGRPGAAPCSSPPIGYP